MYPSSKSRRHDECSPVGPTSLPDETTTFPLNTGREVFGFLWTRRRANFQPRLSRAQAPISPVSGIEATRESSGTAPQPPAIAAVSAASSSTHIAPPPELCSDDERCPEEYTPPSLPDETAALASNPEDHNVLGFLTTRLRSASSSQSTSTSASVPVPDVEAVRNSNESSNQLPGVVAARTTSPSGYSSPRSIESQRSVASPPCSWDKDIEEFASQPGRPPTSIASAIGEASPVQSVYESGSSRGSWMNDFSCYEPAVERLNSDDGGVHSPRAVCAAPTPEFELVAYPTCDKYELCDYRTPEERASDPISAFSLEAWLLVWDCYWRRVIDAEVTKEEIAVAESLCTEIRGLWFAQAMAATTFAEEQTAHGCLEDLAELPYYVDIHEGDEIWAEDFNAGYESSASEAEYSGSDADAWRHLGRRHTLDLPSPSEASDFFVEDVPPASFRMNPPFEIMSDTEEANVVEDKIVEHCADNGDTDERDRAAEFKGRIISIYNQYEYKWYTLHGTIGEGGCARIFHATDDNGKSFAVKVTHKMHAFRSPVSRKLLLQELAIMGAARAQRCKRLQGVIESWENGENVFFLMDIMHGDLRRTLSHRTREKVSLDEKYYCAEMVYAVYLLHGAGVIHRDIKPDNFLMNENGQCVLADFGLAFYPKNTRGVPFECRTTHGYYGTPGYLSPEQERRQDYNFKIDIWQLGCVWIEMFACLSGPWMYQHPEVFSLGDDEARSVLRDSVRKLCKDPRDPVDLLQRMTEVNPRDRPTARQIMEHSYFEGVDWHDVANDKSLHSFRPDPVIPDTERVTSFDFATFHQGVGSGFKEYGRDYAGDLVAPKGVRERIDMWKTHRNAFAWPRRKS